MWHSFQSLNRLLDNSIKKKGLAGKVENTLIMEEFSKIAGNIWDAKIVADMKPMYVKNNILYIAVLNSVLAQEISMRKKLILNELHRKFGKIKVGDIKIDY